MTDHITTADDVVSDIERRIATGQLSPLDRVEPVRKAAERMGLAPNTVASAYRTLGERGLLVGEGRRGTFIASRPAVATAMYEQIPDGIVDLALGNPDPTLLPDLSPALRSVESAHVLYDSRSVDDDLKALFVEAFANDGVETADVRIVGGALDGIERVLDAHLRPGDRIAVEDPGYHAVTELVVAMGYRVIPLPIDTRGPTVDGLLAACRAGALAAIITPRAQNPTGAAIDAERAEELRRVHAANPHVLVIEDDHAGRVAGAPLHRVTTDSSARWAMVRSVAKSLGPDLRLAALIGDETTVARVRGRQMLGTGWVSHILQRIVASLLRQDDIGATLMHATSTYTHRRTLFVNALAKGGLHVEARSGFNVWIPVSDEGQVVAGMERRGFAIRSGARHRQHSGPGVRITTAHSDDATLEAAAQGLLEIVGGAPSGRSV